MISGLQSCEFVFGLEMMTEDLKKVNEFQKGQKYMDETAAISKKGHAIKGEHTISPLMKEFEYGSTGERYWCYEHMVLQLEYCIDVLKVIYPQFDFLFLFNNFCGHNRQQGDGLNAENMSKYYGGKQAYLRDSKINEEKGYLGPYK